jgi:hypothetical protein
MDTRSRGRRSVTTVVVAAVLIIGSFAPVAHAAPKGKPPVTPPGVPPGQPFQALQKQIDALDVRLDALEAVAPQAGIMWINQLDLKAGAAVSSLDAVTAGLVLTAAGAGGDVARTGLEVPLGYGLTGVTVCYVSGASGSFIDAVEVVEHTVPSTFPPTTTVLASSAPVPPAAGSSSCVHAETAAAVDPSAGGPLFLSLGLAYTGADAVTIDAIGIYLEPLGAP